MDSKPTAGLQNIGYNEQEARFLYPTATHSGYFTRRQFLRFTHQTKGCLAHRFTSKLLTQNHAQATQYGHKTFVFKLTSRKLYELIGKENLRHHRPHTADFIRSRLLTLDFILAHPEHRYFETEVEKLKFFREHMSIQSSILPGQTSGIEGLDSTLKRHRNDGFPVFLSASMDCRQTSAVPAFVYPDPANHGFSWFASYLDRHRIFLRRLPAFDLIYASPSSWKLDRAAQAFMSRFRDADHPDPGHLASYFQIRRLWETHKHGSITRADRDLLRDGDKRYRVEPFESAYQKWFAAGISELDLVALLGPCFLHQQVGFQTFLLPENHDFLCCQNPGPLDLHLKTLVPLPVLRYGLSEHRCKSQQRLKSGTENQQQFRRGKVNIVAGSDPVLSQQFGAKTRARGLGSLPATMFSRVSLQHPRLPPESSSSLLIGLSYVCAYHPHGLPALLSLESLGVGATLQLPRNVDVCSLPADESVMDCGS